MSSVRREHNQFRAWPLLPGTRTFWRQARCSARGFTGKGDWVLEFEPTRLTLDPLMGWTGGGEAGIASPPALSRSAKRDRLSREAWLDV